MREYLTYDDVQILPKYSEVTHRANCSISTHVTKNWELRIPIVSSPMDTVTECVMAQEMNELGGLGIIHRFMGIHEQADHVGRVTLGPSSAAIGITGDFVERAQELVQSGCKILCMDVAHGHHKLVGDAIEEIKNDISEIEVVAGSVATGDGAKFLCEKGADALRVGIGNGSLCETRIRTGVGLPQVTALLDVCSTADNYNVPVIADGGIRNVGDVCKGLGCGADTIMVGSLLSGTKESPGTIEKKGQWPNEQLHKKYRGSASRDSKGNDKNVEGNHKVIPYKGKVKRILKDIQEGIRSAFSYVGANDISEFHSKVELIQVTRAGNIEGKPHLLNS